jgi:hypothetical protein
MNILTKKKGEFLDQQISYNLFNVDTPPPRANMQLVMARSFKRRNNFTFTFTLPFGILRNSQVYGQWAGILP